MGIRFLAQSRLVSFAGRVLMVTSGMSDAEIFRAIEDGAAGIFLKNSPLAELIQAISRVTKGETWIDPGVAKSLIRAVRQPGESITNEKLSNRERDVLRGILEGLSNKEISLRLGLSESSIKASLQQLFARTGVRTRSQLAQQRLAS